MARASSRKATTRPAAKSTPKVKPKEKLTVHVNPYKETSTKASATFTLFRDSFLSSQWDDTQEPYEKLLKKYGKSTTWVYIAVSRVATATAQIPVQVIYRDREGQPDAIVRGYDRGLRALLENPNPYQSWTEFTESASVSLNLTGNLFIELVDSDGDSRPEEMYVLNPGRMSIVGHPTEFIRGYIYSVNGKDIKFKREDIIHVKLPHPYNDYYGLAPTSSARMAIETDVNAQEWNRSFMMKGGWPGGAIQTKEAIDEQSAARLKKEIKANLSKGKDTAGKILLLTHGMEYNAIAIKPKDSDWLDARRMSRDEILAIWGVPYAVACLFSTEQTTARSAGVEQQIKQFYRGTVVSHQKRMLDALNRDLVPRFSLQYKLVPDLRSVPALADDIETELKRATAARTLITAGMSINQVMAYFYPTMQPVPWGDVALLNQATVAIAGPFNPVLQNEDGSPIPGGISGPGDGTVGKPKPAPKKPTKEYLLDDEALAAYRRVQDSVSDKLESNED